MAVIVSERLSELQQARKVLANVLAVNLSLSAMKLVCGILTGTLSIAAEGFHSLLDTAANAVAVIGLTLSLAPPDQEHPYGHKKFEALSAIAISFFMFLASFEIGQEIVHRLFTHGGEGPTVGPFSYAVIIVTALANLLICRWERKRGKELNCEILLVDGQHTLSDLWASLAVLSTLVGIQLKFNALDIICSAAIVVFILKAGYAIVASQIGTLVDEARLDPLAIEKIVLSIDGVSGCHKIRSRGTRDHVFIDLHVQVSSHSRMQDAHEISFQVEEKLKAALAGVVEVLVHLEDDEPPLATESPAG
jgi:cation diffusion facilitator family transporter